MQGANFLELWLGEVRRIPLPRTSVNRERQALLRSPITLFSLGLTHRLSTTHEPSK
jgi:hypothetical protein